MEYKQDLATPSTPGLVTALPEECIREILLRLSDPSDLDRASKTCETMKAVASEKRVWRELVQTHFTKLQVFVFSSMWQTDRIFVNANCRCDVFSMRIVLNRKYQIIW